MTLNIEKNSELSLELEPIDKGPERFICPFCGHRQTVLPECERCGANIKPKKSIKPYLITAIFLLTILVLFVFIIRDQDGNMIISLDEQNNLKFNTPDWSKSTKEAEGWVKEGKSLSADKVSVHKWQDNNGVWHYSEKAPQEGGKTQIINVNLETNIIPNHKSQ